MTLSRVDSGRNIREAFRFHKENCVRNAAVNAYREGIIVCSGVNKGRSIAILPAGS